MAVTEERQVLRESLEEHQRDLREAVNELRLAATAYADVRDPIRERTREFRPEPEQECEPAAIAAPVFVPRG